ncbi:polygalacturonase inhibitor-like [Dorcoceras hygrometricum]|uniref:Polygalacturonase inhibitor-like n=1 Tax=Dorcoceras hygrometricum TaxID=472368 RepID=A0A2Z7CJD4_9LAMI|nr:polygalacturonase inhibitor-like [Dorcoceras hygrometricum]
MLRLILLLLLTPLPAEFCNPDDKSALLAVKNSFPNADNIFSSWTDDFHCCDWYGIECDETTNNVISLAILRTDKIIGTIPPAISKLKHLQTLYLFKLPNLVGEIPQEMGEMVTLRSVDISWTNVSGPVPRFLSKLTNLLDLDLSFNRLSGSIPPYLATLPRLRILDLSRNQLVGPIPDSFGQFASKNQEFSALHLSHNKLSGELPPSLKNMNITSVDLSRNNLSGDGSVLFGDTKVNYALVISRNMFEFDFPRVRFPKMLETLDVSHNRIYGSIPAQITAAERLQRLNLTYNRLCGKIPTQWNLVLRVENFDNTSYFHNRCLCGVPLDPCK